MNILKGDLIQLAKAGYFDVIVHGCNCFCTMGAGIARQIQTHFPEAFEADLKTVPGDKAKLGTYSLARVHTRDHTLVIVNAYTQFHYSGSGTLVSYDAVRKIFSRLKVEFSGQKLAYPKIGAGLAKGNWEMISAIINQELDGMDHTLVDYVKQTAADSRT